MMRVLTEIEQSAGLTINDLMSRLNNRYGVIEKALKLLEVDGAVVRDGTVFARTTNPWTPDLLHSEQVTQNRRAELEEIKRYVKADGCLMEFLARALDDPTPGRCGKCMNCSGQTRRQEVSRELTQSAVEFLRHADISFEPRKQWPSSALTEIQEAMPKAVGLTKQLTLSTKIPAELRAEQGRALSIYGDAGWGRIIADGKYVQHHFSDELVRAAAAFIRDRWRPAPFPEWITCVPSTRHPELVSDFTRRLALELRLPFKQTIKKLRETELQKRMENRDQQVRNLLAAFSVDHDILNAPVILVDDVIDSGWTMTIIATLMKIEGSGPVFPFALARATAGDS
jgi:ATP-dependent DNA helicase RecQ